MFYVTCFMKILKSLGQNFLIDKNIIKKVIESADLKQDDFVLEIGPGRGALTFELAKYAGKVLAIEKDKGLAKELEEKIKNDNIGNIEIIHEDALKMFKNTRLKPREPEINLGRINKIISNPPYEIAARLIVDFLKMDKPPSKIVFVIQKEIAQRVISKPSDMNIISVITQAFGDPKIIANIPRQCFYPQPRVDSAILSIDIIKDHGIADKEKFIQLVKAGFSSKRKFLINNLSERLKIQKADLESVFQKIGIGLKSRAEELSVEEWKEINGNIAGFR